MRKTKKLPAPLAQAIADFSSSLEGQSYIAYIGQNNVTKLITLGWNAQQACHKTRLTGKIRPGIPRLPIIAAVNNLSAVTLLLEQISEPNMFVRTALVTINKLVDDMCKLKIHEYND